MKETLKLRRIYLLGLAPISFLLIFLARQNSYFTEKIFALHIYKWISQFVSFLSGLLPVSLAEILILIIPIIIIIRLIRFLIRMIKDRENRKIHALKGVLNLLCFASVTLFLFTLLAGINYYRYPFSRYSNLEIRESSVEELYEMTESLALQANELRRNTPAVDDRGVFQLSVGKYEVADRVNKAMTGLSEEFPVLGGKYSSPKPIFLSSLMSYTEITGIFIPFTMEANVNVDIPDYTIPVTMLHELAHLRGFMREDEANFIAYLAGMHSNNVELQYSSTMLALVMSGNALYKQDPELYFKIRELYSVGVLKDIRANSEYWVKYEDTVISTVSNKINDTYLKVNAQADGVKSYGRMLDLLLAKYRKDNGK